MSFLVKTDQSDNLSQERTNTPGGSTGLRLSLYTYTKTHFQKDHFENKTTMKNINFTTENKCDLILVYTVIKWKVLGIIDIIRYYMVLRGDCHVIWGCI